MIQWGCVCFRQDGATFASHPSRGWALGRCLGCGAEVVRLHGCMLSARDMPAHGVGATALSWLGEWLYCIPAAIMHNTGKLLQGYRGVALERGPSRSLVLQLVPSSVVQAEWDMCPSGVLTLFFIPLLWGGDFSSLGLWGGEGDLCCVCRLESMSVLVLVSSKGLRVSIERAR
jgi:hypothetical protein